MTISGEFHVASSRSYTRLRKHVMECMLVWENNSRGMERWRQDVGSINYRSTDFVLVHQQPANISNANTGSNSAILH